MRTNLVEISLSVFQAYWILISFGSGTIKEKILLKVFRDPDSTSLSSVAAVCFFRLGSSPTSKLI